MIVNCLIQIIETFEVNLISIKKKTDRQVCLYCFFVISLSCRITQKCINRNKGLKK